MKYMMEFPKYLGIYFLRCSKHEKCTNASYVWSQRPGTKLVGFDCHAAAWNSLRTGCLQQGTSQGVAKQKALIRFGPLIMIYIYIQIDIIYIYIYKCVFLCRITVSSFAG